MIRFTCEDNNIDEIRSLFPLGLHFVVGDTHGQYATLKALLEKIKFDPAHDHVWFLGDYNEGGDPRSLLQFISNFYQADHTLPGFHLIRGNHERELYSSYPLENLPDIAVIKLRHMQYYLAHAGMIGKAFDFINADIAQRSDESIFVYKLDEACTKYDAPLRQLVWSLGGLYMQNQNRPQLGEWPTEISLYQNKAVILHGHTPYCYLLSGSYYGDDSLFWTNQKIWFSEDLQSFDLDANVKGVIPRGAVEYERSLTCVCLEVFDEIAGSNNCSLSIPDIQNAVNGVFSVKQFNSYESCEGDIDLILSATPEMKLIRVDECKDLYFA